MFPLYFGKGDSIALAITKNNADCSVVPNLSGSLIVWPYHVTSYCGAEINEGNKAWFGVVTYRSW